MEEGDEALNQPGFDDLNTDAVSPVRKGKAIKSQVDLSGKRVTRSQAKQSNCNLNKIASGVGVREGSPLGSERTTDSILKIAKESLEVGELLGIKVIANKENALKRITKSLKSQRLTRSTHKEN